MAHEITLKSGKKLTIERPTVRDICEIEAPETFNGQIDALKRRTTDSDRELIDDMDGEELGEFTVKFIEAFKDPLPKAPPS